MNGTARQGASPPSSLGLRGTDAPFSFRLCNPYSEAGFVASTSSTYLGASCTNSNRALLRGARTASPHLASPLHQTCVCWGLNQGLGMPGPCPPTAPLLLLSPCSREEEAALDPVLLEVTNVATSLVLPPRCGRKEDGQGRARPTPLSGSGNTQDRTAPLGRDARGRAPQSPPATLRGANRLTCRD